MNGFIRESTIRYCLAGLMMSMTSAACVSEMDFEEPGAERSALSVQDESVTLCRLGCDSGFHPIRYDCDSRCSSLCSGYNSVTCEPNQGTFTTCATGCPAGWHPIHRHPFVPDCQTSLSNDAVTCEPNGPVFDTCALNCPPGWQKTDSWGDSYHCGVGNDMIRCEAPTGLGSLSTSGSSTVGGSTVTGQIDLTGPAPASGMVVALSSNDSSVQVPSTVTVAPGATSRTFNIRTGSVSAIRSVNLTASAGGSSVHIPWTVRPNTPIASFALARSSVTGGNSVRGTFSLASPASSSGTSVRLTSSHPSIVPVPFRVVAGGHRRDGSFSVSTGNVLSNRNVTLSALSNGVIWSQSLMVRPTSSNTTPGSGAIFAAPGCQANILPPNDDGSSPRVTLPFSIDFFGNTYSSIYINNNGNVTFQRPLRTYTPFRLTAHTPPIIAPFFGDVDTRGAGSGVVHYSYGPVRFGNRDAFCVNWINVGYYYRHTDKLNSFQLLLVDRSDVGPGDFDIVMNYDRIQWEAGDASGGWRGLGGISAGAGYSAGTGQASAFYEFPGSLVNGAFLDGNSEMGLARTSRNSVQPGRHIFEVRNGAAPTGGSIAGQVTDQDGPVAGAPVQICPSSSGPCSVITRTGGNGRYIATGLPEGSYDVMAFPSATSSAMRSNIANTFVTLSSDFQTNGQVDIALNQPQQIPDGASLTPSHLGDNEVPVVNAHDDLDLEVRGCEDGAASYEVFKGSTAIADGAMFEAPRGTYVVKIPKLHPAQGPMWMSVSIQCPSETVESIVFDIHVDSSGTIRTLDGQPIPGAVVTLLRSDSPQGPFEPVPAGSAVLSPVNRTNPDLADAEGRFRWDAIAGYYVVRAEREGCQSITGEPYVESDVLTVPSAIAGLDLRMDCPFLDNTPPTSTASATPAPNENGWNNMPVTVEITATDDRSGVADIVYSLTGAQSDSGAVAGAGATVTITAEGATLLSWHARDMAGNEEEPHTMEIRIDSTPPLLSCEATPSVLFPPNHQMVPVSVDVQSSDGPSGLEGPALLLSVESSEPDDGLGDGHTDGDMQEWDIGTSDGDGLLRAERSGNGPGRIYTLIYEAADLADNHAICEATVSVSHSRKR